MTLKYIKLIMAWFRKSVWGFPVIILFLFLLATATGVNGSSVGMYHVLLYGDTTKDPALIYGEPKSIRSDEFLIFTPRVASQFQAGNPLYNENINSGRETVTTAETPITDWVGIFRPHTAGYFFLPFSNAFAFAWWFGLMALIIPSYFFFLRIFRESKLVAILLSLSLSLSPFVIWWYQVRLLLVLAFFFMAAILLLRLLNREKIKLLKSQRNSDIAYSLALIYIGASMGFLIYVPFILPVFLVLLAFIVGYVIEGLKSGKLKKTRFKRVCLYLGGVMAAIISLGVAFYIDKKEIINTISNSVYPGERRISSGELPFSPIHRFFDSFLMPYLPHPPTGNFYANQSEAANFIFILPFLLLPGFILLAYDYKKNKNLNWILLLLQLLAVLFILRITVPLGDDIYKLLLLDRVPNNRLMIGLGLLTFLQMAYLFKYLEKFKSLTRRKSWIYFVGGLSFLTFISLIIISKAYFSDYLLWEDRVQIGLLALAFTSIVTFVLLNKRLLSVGLLLLFTVISSYQIMPLQKGMPFFEDSAIVNKIREVSSPSEPWAVVDNFTFESLPLIAGRPLINGHQPYADFDFWRQIDKNGQYQDVYNRQGHALFISDTAKADPPFLPTAFASISEEMESPKGTVFKVKFYCSDFVYENIKFVLSTQKPDLPCLELVDEVSYPKATFYIFKVSPPKNIN